jgi:hypothetical protein
VRISQEVMGGFYNLLPSAMTAYVPLAAITMELNPAISRFNRSRVLNGVGGRVMTTASFYVDQAKLLLLWAGTTTNPVIRKQLRQRAQEYLLMADALEVGASPAISELPREPTVQQQQQQQQTQPKKS